MVERVTPEIRQIWDQVEMVKMLSDKVVKIGPMGVGLDGLLTWIPGAGGLYSVGAGAFLLVQAVRAKAEPKTIAKMVGWLGTDALTSEIPIVGDAVDFFFRGHLMAAKVLQRDMERRYGPMRETPEKKRWFSWSGRKPAATQPAERRRHRR